MSRQDKPARHIAVAKTTALEKLKAEMKKHGGKTGTGRSNCRFGFVV